MSKNNLSSEQKEIIKRLTDEFTKINNSIPVSMGLIDVNEIIESTRLKQEFFNECRMANDTFTKLKNNAMLKDMESIRGDLAKLNLDVKRSYANSESFEILSNEKSGIKMRIEYKNSHYYDKNHGEITNRIQCQYVVGMQMGHFSFASCKTFNEFIKTDCFKNELKRLYEWSLK